MAEHSSSLADYRSCPQMYLLKKQHPEIATSTIHTERGTVVHKAAETMVLTLAAGGSRELAEREATRIIEANRGEFAGEAIDEAEFFLRKLKAQPFPEKKPGEEWIAEWSFAFDKDWRLLPWPEDGGKFSPPDGTFFYGTADFIRFDPSTGFVAVRDWKSARKAESPATLAGGIQLPAYAEGAMALLESRGVDVGEVRIERHYTTTGILQAYTLTQEEKDGAIRDRIAGEIAAMGKDREFVPRPEATRCMGCAVKFLCPAYKASGQEWMEPATPEDALRLYREAEVAVARAEQAKEFVKGWVAQKGPIPLENGGFLDFKPVEKRQVVKNGKDVLRANGWSDGQIADACSLSVTALDKVLDDDDPLWEQVASVRTESRLAEVKEV